MIKSFTDNKKDKELYYLSLYLKKNIIDGENVEDVRDVLVNCNSCLESIKIET